MQILHPIHPMLYWDQTQKDKTKSSMDENHTSQRKPKKRHMGENHTSQKHKTKQSNLKQTFGFLRPSQSNQVTKVKFHCHKFENSYRYI